MSGDQHLPEITVPDIEIADGWAVSEVFTIEDCDDAFAYLMSAVAEIEYELEVYGLGVRKFPDPLWPARARKALKYKRAALQLVGYERGRIMDEAKRAAQNNRDRALLDHIKASVSAHQFHQWVVGVASTEKDSEAA